LHHPSEISKRGETGLIGGETLRCISSRGALHVILDLVVQFAVEPPSMEQRRPAAPQATP
jgi:hypothetical protein